MRLRLLLIATFTAALLQCSDRKDAPVSFSGDAMGTTWKVTFARSDRRTTEEEIAAEIERIEAMASLWREDSFLTKFNGSRSTAPIPCPPEIAEMAAFAIELNEKTDAAFDITIAPVVSARGFGPTQSGGSSEAVHPTGSAHLTVISDPPSLQKAIPGLQIDLNSIAKGYAVDLVAEFLDSHDCSDYLIEIGGELRARGRNGDGKLWKVGIENPDAASIGEVSQVVELDNEAIATSGTYRHFRISQSNSHIIDPRTKSPVNHGCPAVSVIARTCMEADAWATALLVLGPEKGAAIAKQERIEVVFGK